METGNENERLTAELAAERSDRPPVKYFRETLGETGPIVAVYGSSSIGYVERLRAELAAEREKRKRAERILAAYHNDEADIYAEADALWFIHHNMAAEMGRMHVSLLRAEERAEKAEKELALLKDEHTVSYMCGYEDGKKKGAADDRAKIDSGA